MNFSVAQFLIALDARLARIESLLQQILEKEIQLVKTIDDVLADVQSETTVIAGAVTLLNNLTTMIKNAGTDPAKIDGVLAAIDANKQTLAAAILANTPTSTTPPPPPPPPGV